MKANLLVVDDEKEIQDMLARHFKFLGYHVNTANNGVDALDKLEQDKFDVIVSDIMMPEMDGIELLAKTREEYPMIKTIMITGYVTLENALSAMRIGADTCIFKPLEDLEVLEQAVERAVIHTQHWISILSELQTMKPAGGGS